MSAALMSLIAGSVAGSVSPPSNFRWVTLSNGNVVESGSGPYTYTYATAAGATQLSAGTLKFPVGVASELVLRKVALNSTSPDLEYMGLLFDTSNTVAGTQPLALGCLGDFFYYYNDGTWHATACVIGIGSKVKLRRDAANTLYVETWDAAGGPWVTQATIAGGAVDYFAKFALDTGGGVGMGYLVESATGMTV